jgi:hypothetical protein
MVDEINASHVLPGSIATAMLKGDSTRQFPMQFVRIVPYMVPKQNLTGSNSERVNVRMLQLEFRFEPQQSPVYVGQQVTCSSTPRRELRNDQPSGLKACSMKHGQMIAGPIGCNNRCV